MANPAGEKLKALAIRHGEKAVVGITATACVVFIVLAIMNPVLDMKPEELKTSATSAQSNLQTKQTETDILAKLEKEGLKEPNFQKIIDGQLANALKPDDYRSKLDWVSPEPGAGLIRDQPELIAPVELTAFPGRGGILIYALDDKGERIIAQDADPKAPGKGGRPGGILGAAPPGGGGPDAKKKQTAEEKKRLELAEEKRAGQFAGKEGAAPEKKAEAEAAPPPEGPWKEETKGKRWVVITATLDHAKLKKNYFLALKNEAIAYPSYKRVDVERQTLQTDGSWSDWVPTEKEKNYEVIDNLPQNDTEYVPESQRPSALVDPLPFLKAGYWTGVHVAKLVPPEILNKKAEVNVNSGGEGPGPGGPGGKAGGGMVGGKAMGGGDSRQSGPAGMMGGKAMGGGDSRQSGGPGGPGAGPDESVTKLDEPTVMIRSLDFTVEPGQTYRFRIRIVVANPNYEHTDVNPGVDVTSKSLLGPWSEPSPLVAVPADIVTYVQAPDAAERRSDLVTFQVVRWDPASGQTVIKPDARGPGEIIGEYGAVPMPNSEGKGPKSERIDFNSRSIVLDTFGGRQKLPEIGVPRNQFDVPALAMIVEPNGDVVIRSQAFDLSDEVRQDMDTGYRQAIEDSTKERKSASNSRMPGMGQGSGKNRSRGGRPPGGGASRQGGGRTGSSS